jgi:hypothetical protein
MAEQPKSMQKAQRQMPKIVVCHARPFGRPHWKDYLLIERRPLIEKLACMGSHAAKAMLGVDARDNFGAVTDSELADRFFLGDLATLAALRSAYRGER